MDEFKQEWKNLIDQFKREGFSDEEIRKACFKNVKDPDIKRQYAKELKNQSGVKSKGFKVCCWFFIPCVISVVFAVLYIALSEGGFGELSDWVRNYTAEMPCLLEHNEISLEVTRPLFDCSLCQGLDKVPVETNISKERFEEMYAYTSIPVVISGTALNWTAGNVFTFDFLKSLYTEDEESLDYVESQCQFFQYNTYFKTLRDVFNMPKEMSEMKQDKWYIGWSNCYPAIQEELKKHYSNPTFLPTDSVSTHLQWIFMGGWGQGASLHLDNVERPSWQAQLSGTKTWTLVPVPECESRCHTLKVKVNTGDIIVVDTNQWYHSTYIHPGKISITIGSEYS